MRPLHHLPSALPALHQPAQTSPGAAGSLQSRPPAPAPSAANTRPPWPWCCTPTPGRMTSRACPGLWLSVQWPPAPAMRSACRAAGRSRGGRGVGSGRRGAGTAVGCAGHTGRAWPWARRPAAPPAASAGGRVGGQREACCAEQQMPLAVLPSWQVAVDAIMTRPCIQHVPCSLMHPPAPRARRPGAAARAGRRRGCTGERWR